MDNINSAHVWLAQQQATEADELRQLNWMAR